jgi:hypothetical protein
MKTTGIEYTMSHLYPKQPISIDDSSTILLIRKALGFVIVVITFLSVCINLASSFFCLAFVRVIGMEAEPPNFNRSLFTLYPLALFEVVHQHVYKATSFNDFRRKSTMIETTILRQSRAMRSTLNDDNFSSVTSQLRENEMTLRKEKQKWQASSWVFTLLEWHRTTAWRSMYQKN